MAHPNKSKILRLRLYRKLTQNGLSKRILLSQSCINQLEIGTQINPSLDTIVKYLKMFNISFFEFVDGETSKALILSFTKTLVEDNVITMEDAANICKYYEIKL